MHKKKILFATKDNLFRFPLVLFLTCLFLCTTTQFVMGAPFEPEPVACTHVQIRRVTAALNIRPTAGTSQSAIGTVPANTCLAVLQSTSSGQDVKGDKTWYKIKYNNITGWIAGYYAGCSSCGGPPPECTNGQTRACYTGASGTRNKGDCRDGTQTCAGSKWGSCAGEKQPQVETCDGHDNNCDGSTDEGNPGGGASCSSGSCGAGTKVCKNGVLVCEGSSSGVGKSCDTGLSGSCAAGIGQCKSGKFVCLPSQKTKPELCDNNDNDCNGKIDDGLQRACYTGPANTNGEGICSGGQQTCKAGQWGTCEGELTPQSGEVCGNQKDDDCNGKTDENCGTGTCSGGQTESCYSGPAHTKGVGYCKTGIRSCLSGKWGPCRNERTPLPNEICNNKTDDNCNGDVDENCTGPQGSCEDKDKDGYGIGSTCKKPYDCDDNDPKVHPKASELCGNKKDDDCSDGDLPCVKLTLGEVGCTKPSECTTDFCVKLSGVQRCSEPCKINSDCPVGFSCVQKQACWPIQKGNPDTAKKCSADQQCGQGEFCDRGFCAKKKGGIGCDTSGRPQEPTNLLFLFLLLGLIGVRWKKSSRC